MVRIGGAGFPVWIHENNGESMAAPFGWTTMGVVTPAQYPGQCGSCWSPLLLVQVKVRGL